MRARALIRASGSLCLAAALAGCASLDPERALLCQNIVQVAVEQEQGAPARSIEYYSYDDPNAIMAVACKHGGDPALKSLCDTILEHSSHEFLDAFAYDVVGCVQRSGRVLSVQTTLEPSGLLHHPHGLHSMRGRLRGTDISIDQRDGGFELTFHRT